jgi:hypothetical protein
VLRLGFLAYLPVRADIDEAEFPKGAFRFLVKKTPQKDKESKQAFVG